MEVRDSEASQSVADTAAAAGDAEPEQTNGGKGKGKGKGKPAKAAVSCCSLACAGTEAGIRLVQAALVCYCLSIDSLTSGIIWFCRQHRWRLDGQRAA